MISLHSCRLAAVIRSGLISLVAQAASAAAGVALRARSLSKETALGEKLVALLISAVFGVYSYSVFASAPFEPPDFKPPAYLVGIAGRITALFEPALATDPPLPRIDTSAYRAPLSVGELEGFDVVTSTQALNITLPTAVGRIASSSEVSATGNATYTIPIWTPPGARGIEPHPALVYASGTPDSLLGPGWSLSGLSSIARCTLTWEQDGTPGPVTLTLSDKFCLDGNRLRFTGGTNYGAANSTYQTEIEIFSKVIARGDVGGNGPQWFEVKGKDGLTYEYGNTSDSRVFATNSPTPYLWALNKVRDRQGNNLVISYLQSNGSFRPNSIRYTQTPTTAYHYEIVFGYINRATGTNLHSYVGGSKVQQEMLLSSVRALSDGVLVRQYNLDYTTAPATQRGRLSAVQECTATDCLHPTTITYQDGQKGVASVTTSAGTGATSGRVNTLDIDGDGRMDLVYSTVSGSSHTWWVKFATSTGFGTAVNTGVVNSSTDPVLFDDFDANGSIDLLAPLYDLQSGPVWFVFRWTGSAFTRTSTGQTVDANSPYFVSADVNGDGLPDLVSGPGDLYTRLNTTAGSSVSFSTTATLAFSFGGRPVLGLWGNNSIPHSPARYMDFDGDGRGDVFVEFRHERGIAPLPLLSRGGTFVAGGGIGNLGSFEVPIPVAWNEDKCTDIAIAGVVWVAGCSTNYPFYIIAVIGVLAMDWDADGRTDLLANSGGSLQVYRSTGDGVAAPVSTGIPAGSGSWNAFDQNGDGLADLAFVNSSAGNAVTYGLHNGANVMPDLATSITDGFGMNASFSYKSIAAWSSCYVRDSAPPAPPARAFVGPIYVACTLTASDGTGGTYQVQHSYYNSNLHLQGRGWLGFERRYVIDNRDGIVNMETYSQTFPHIGMTLYSLARQSNWTTKIREIKNTLDSLPFGTGYDTRSFPYVRQSEEDAFEVGGNLNGQWITRATTTTVVDSFGNPKTVTASVVDKSTASPWFGETYTTKTVNTITNNTANWCLGRPTQTTVTSTLPDNTSQTRTTDAIVDYVNCRNTQEVIEPASTTLKVTTAYGFESCGNVGSVNVVGKNADGTDMPTRTTFTNYGARCQFPESTTNALNQTTQRSYRYDLGLVSSETDPNGIAVSWVYDGYGRKTQETRPDGTYTLWSFGFCDASNSYCGVADLRWSTSEHEYDTTGAQIRYKHLFHDGFNRPRYDGRLNLAGTLTWHAIIGYDARGNKWYQYNAYSSTNNGYTSFSYDLINRPIVAALYNSSGAWDRQALIAYVGPAVTFTDPKGNVSAKYFDARRNLRQVVDPAPGGTTHYTWDHFSNLLTTTDPIGAGSSATYDVRGFKRTSYDADAGDWTYTPNSLGEVVSQEDANGRTTTIAYDELGRMKSRTELEGTSAFNFGTSAVAKNIGKLESIVGQGYSEVYTYDSIGRPLRTTYNADTTYQVDYAYNVLTGFLDNVTYPTSTGSRLRVQYLYTNGILSHVRDFNAPTTVWWQLNAEDARGNPIDEQFENGVHALSDFDGMTGHLNWRMSGNNAQYNNHQNLTFEWDKNENLDKRIDVNQSNLTERFFYDALDRLDYSTRNGTTNLDVLLDAAGNIQSKTSVTEPFSNVGTYNYHQVKRHAVASTSNGWTFTYDANGNMLTGRGATITWYSYNLPKTITNGSLTSEFFYTPDRKYWRQNANHSSGFENTIYIGGLLEKVSRLNAGTEYRHMIRAGTVAVIVSRNTNGSNNTYYATQDHLGSTAVITNSSGTVVVKESFGSFGNRRGSDWQGSPSGPDLTAIASTTRRGFTGHTMVDNLTLIHMNGRMYDPWLGRFLSPDPFVQSLAQSQSLNPYSYCWNNPLKYIDPSGFGIFSKIGRAFKKALRWVVNVLKQIVIQFVIATISVAVCGYYAAVVCAVAINVGLRSGYSSVYGGRGGFGGTATGPPFGGTPGINPTPGIPGLMSYGGLGNHGVWAQLRTMSPPNWLVDFLAGVGDVALAMITLGVGDGAEYRAVMGIGSVDPNSVAYQIGYWSAVGASLGLGRIFTVRGAAPQTLPTAVQGTPQVGDKVYRVFGADARGGSRYWTRTDPHSVPNYRDAAGLPSQPGITGYAGGNLNSGGFVAEGRLVNTAGVRQATAAPLHGNRGGIDELYIPHPESQVVIERVYGVNPPF